MDRSAENAAPPHPAQEETTPRLVVAAALTDDLAAPSRLLAARRTRPAALAGQWELPGGKVEPGEDPVDALHRELREELGIEAELGHEVRNPAGGRWPLTPSLDLRLWWARIVRGEPEPLEDHDELRWLAPGTWSDLPWLPADIVIVAHLQVSADDLGPAVP